MPAIETTNAAANHQVRITRAAYRAYKESIAVNPPETFALIGGSLNDPMLITDFHFMAPRRDENGSFVASGSFVYPDHEQVNYIIDNVLVRKGHYILGLWHSHPGGLTTPSGPDLDFCGRIIANDDSEGRRWNHFLAPITTFDADGGDRITAWVLPKGGQRFEEAGFAVEPDVAAEVPLVARESTRSVPRRNPASRFDILARAYELACELERNQCIELIPAYRIWSGLAQIQHILAGASLLRGGHEGARPRRRTSRDR